MFKFTNYISIKIFIIQISVILFIGALFFVLNSFFINRIREDIIYQQIEDYIDSGAVPTEVRGSDKFDGVIMIYMDIGDGVDSHNIPSDRHDNRISFKEIYKNISLSQDQRKGKVESKFGKIYYIVEWVEADKRAAVYLAVKKPLIIPTHEILVVLFIIIVTSFAISMIVAKVVSSPLEKLEKFADRVALKEWDVEIPVTSNDEIGRLTLALSKMKDSLRDAEERENNFLQTTSHDLKTPVMVIKGYAQAIIDGVDVAGDASAEVILEESARLERKIGQLLHVNTISSSLMNGERESVRIDRILNNLIKRFRVIRPELEWRVDLKDVEINGNIDSLLIAFENIIDNQIRFAESYISISIKSEDRTIIEISNDGPGFSVENPNSLFDIYQKDREGNFGLGLNIVKKVVDFHDGEIKALNSDNGVVFIILL